jgi:hypothetical protein
MFGEKRVVDNRVFLLGLDALYRNAMKSHEAGELLTCARRIARALGIEPGNIQVEGYYTESPELTEYFHLIRTLQGVHEASIPTVKDLKEYGRLLEVVSSPLFGRPVSGGNLLPTGRDPLSQALLETMPNWRLESLVAKASTIAYQRDDYSLVGLAARCKDAVVLTATRESVVLYAEMVVMSALGSLKPRYVWEVDKDLSEAAGQFVETFNRLFGDQLPTPKKRFAEDYWLASRKNEVLGRCVRIGSNNSSPALHYHWAVYREKDFAVHDFWHREVWTTERYRSALRENRGRPQLG